MGISDWSSDVCSSDLMAAGRCAQRRADDGRVRPRHAADDVAADLVERTHEAVAAARPLADYRRAADPAGRAADDGRTASTSSRMITAGLSISEERHVGKRCDRT